MKKNSAPQKTKTAKASAPKTRTASSPAAGQNKPATTPKQNNSFFMILLVVLIVTAILSAVYICYNRTTMSGCTSNTQTNEMTSEKTVDQSALLTANNWQWVETQMNNDSIIKSTVPEKFVLTFDDESGLMFSTTDCNSGRGQYVLSGLNNIKIGPLASTLMFCGEESQEQVYFRDLTAADSYMIKDGQLVLMLPMDSGSMIFNPVVVDQAPTK